jgi:DNA-binding MarR family transcriptional regulator
MSKHWTFLSHHAHVLLALTENPNLTIEEMAKIANLTTRSIVNVLKDLEDGGYLVKTKEGRNNRYEINLSAKLRHSTSGGHTVGELIKALGSIGR